MTWNEAKEVLSNGGCVRLPSWPANRFWKIPVRQMYNPQTGQMERIYPELRVREYTVQGSANIVEIARITGGHTKSNKWEEWEDVIKI